MADGSKKSFQIKVLPKKNAGPSVHSPDSNLNATPSPKRPRRKRPDERATSYTPVFVIVAIGLLGLLWMATNKKVNGPNRENASLSAETQKLNRFLQDGQKKMELNELGVTVENSASRSEELPAFLPLDSEGSERRPMGVELEQDPAMENVYNDLYGESRGASIQTPEERINSRLAEKKWVNKFEREEKKMFIRNFISSAREAGYEIELNDDLVVTKVRPITSRPKISLEKVIENLHNQ